MASQEIARQDWTRELDMFSREHEGWIVSVHVIDPNGREQTEVRTLPLHGVSVDDPQKTKVAITVGHSGHAHFTHQISEPVRILVERTDAGADCGLSIRAADGSTTSVEFLSPMHPDEVDGLPHL
jgi:hypothetical protein